MVTSLQGFLDKLLDRHDGLSKEVLRKAVFYIVPCANPDGEPVLHPGDDPVPDGYGCGRHDAWVHNSRPSIVLCSCSSLALGCMA